MALDVYAGTFTRYYTRNWENVAQRQARLDGITYRRISPGEETPPPTADQVTPAVAAWCAELTEALGQNISAPITWDEGEGLPYFTDRPGWEGYIALVLWAAYAGAPHLVRPTSLPEQDWNEDPAFLAMLPRESGTPYRQILQAELWLPCEFKFVFRGPALTGDATWIGSTFALREQLELLNQNTLSVDASDAFAQSARFSLAMFQELSQKACEARLPILLDF